MEITDKIYKKRNINKNKYFKSFITYNLEITNLNLILIYKTLIRLKLEYGSKMYSSAKNYRSRTQFKSSIIYRRIQI